jgi:hypothetical protein
LGAKLLLGRKRMRRLVVADRSGLILATSPHPEDTAPADPQAPRYLGYIPLPGQQVHVVDIPEPLLRPAALRLLHETHHIVIREGQANLAPTAAR